MNDRPAQLAFDLPQKPGMGREDFFVTEANRAALEMVDAWPAGEERSPLLVLTGPAGSGKSHLAAIWRERTSALLATPRDVVAENLPALLSAGRLVIEDMPGDALDETAMFHLVNMARENGAAVLLASREFPSRWDIALPDLRSRLKAAQVAELGPPDDALLRAVLVKLFTDRQLKVGEGVISYMLSRMERSLAAARELVEEIDRRALEEKANVTRPFVARLMRRREAEEDTPARSA